ncbi:NADH dehydrogenase I, G subunit [Syntrophotalea carbinolica DSM 2380]|uniref:NADH dehydrogenase I, G subunit n=1 Tax=Syntrophotalea carbinolica (strain DSM 2380 / NBRC 103641 / GraBd1) TaxID=338963 RepID=Q3A822_SYNC1|nr:NADH-quinone oxidoreductase subunit NuoG [Syntrophotalea carbinolica]ABA87470.1 NADH dehydrogenase I, G subunit [Syntrophotalea carbinolica DSM 2380]
MPTLTIDNQTVTVPEGTNVLEAARQLGIEIPHFCHHEALGSVGACRLCAVKVIDGPVKGIQMSCMLPAKDDMVVDTGCAEVLAYRAQVIEWLMTNHPHDCPVCDEGGECQLQDMTVAGGHGIRRYTGPKRTYRNQDLGPFIAHEMNRCIQCYRCVRTYQDYCGGTDFGVLGSRQRLYFGRFTDGPLESPFAGNLVDVCPTGVLTDKTYRFKSRVWDLQEAASICPHCSLGCAVSAGARYRELQRRRARTNIQTNGHFICDRGRFGYGYVNHPERPRNPLVGHRRVTRQEALASLQTQLHELVELFGSGSIGLLSSSRASLETQFLVQRWAASLGSDRLCFEAHPRRDLAARVAASQRPERMASLADIRQCDVAVVIGADPLAEAPMLALALRQAARRGARIVIVDPRPVEMPMTCERHVVSSGQMSRLLQALGQPRQSDFASNLEELGGSLGRALLEAQSPVLIGGTDVLGPGGSQALLRAAQACSEQQSLCRSMLLLNGPNSFGGAMLSGDGPSFDTLLEGIEQGRIKALLCFEADALADFPDRKRCRAALARLDLLAVFDCAATATVQEADLFFPTTALEETAGTLINNEGRMQAFAKVFAAGTPLSESVDGGHPPRFFSREIPGSQPQPAWATLAGLLGREADSAALRCELEKADDCFAGLSMLAAGDEGRRIAAARPAPPVPEEGVGSAAAADQLQLLVTETLYGSELLSDLSSCLQSVKPEPYVMLHPQDAARLKLEEGKMVRLCTPVGELDLKLRLNGDMATGMAIVPRLRGTLLEPLVPGVEPLSCRIEKA